MRQVLVVAAVVLNASWGLWAQTRGGAPTPNQRLILADQPSRFEAALSEAAGIGLEPVFGSGQAVFLKRALEGAAPRTYRTIMKGGVTAFERELNARGQEGFVALPRTLTNFGGDAMVIMVRAPDGPSSKPAYRVLEWDDSLEKQLAELEAKGFQTLGVFAQQSGMAVRLGRPGRLRLVLETVPEGATPKAALAPGVARLRQVAAIRSSALEKEINKAAADRYRVVGGALMSVALERVDDPAASYSYRIVGAMRRATLVTEIEQAGREGYRVMPTAIMGNPGSQGETVVVMERPSTAPRVYEYEFVDFRDAPVAFARSLSLEASGFLPVGLIAPPIGFAGSDAYLVLYEKGAIDSPGGGSVALVSSAIFMPRDSQRRAPPCPTR